ncbi:hypothetical protein [Stenotrophomonas lactitubi]|uniref:hypothetical protein n=1 Tax=Stenotrophomonas lactitubi TaxID=2045214 RepID=UPI003340125C
MAKTATWREQAAMSARERKRVRRLWITRRKRQVWLEQMGHIRLIAPRKLHPLSEHSEKKRFVRTITPPPVLDLETNYEETIALLKSIRFATRTLNAKFMIDLKALQEVSPAAALLMVAECDRWREKTRQKWLRAVDAAHWVPSVRRRLKEMGFFEVLRTRNVPADATAPGEDRYVPFLTGSRNVGPPAAALRKSIEELGPALVDGSALYDGLVEAMTNVKQHAYRAPDGSDTQRWWISASVNTTQNRMTVLVVDHGVGIARTIARDKKWELLRRILGPLVVKDDAKLLSAAFSLDSVNRSQTGEEHRGKGLRENIKGYVSTHESRGHLHVIANHGRYRFQRDSRTKVESEVSTKLETEFNGTFIEWVIEDYGHQPNQDN